jgi:hypothetical protein
LRLFILLDSSFLASDFALDNISFSGKNNLSLSLILPVLPFDDCEYNNDFTASKIFIHPDDPEK